MREGWRRVALGEIATRRKDFTPVDAATMYRIVGVQRSGWGLVDRDPARGDSMKFDKLMRLNAKDLVYRTITAFEAPSTVVDESFAGAFVTPNTFPVYVLNQSQVLPGYMALLTTDPRFHEAMASRTVGSVLRRKTLSQKAFESIPIDLPPLAEQRRIVDLIAAVDDAIEAAEVESASSQSAWQTLCEVIKSRDDSVVRSVDQVVDVARSGGTPSRAIDENFGGGIPWLKSGEVRGRCITAVEESISEQGLLSSAAWLAPAGSVLVAMYGGGTVGQVGRLGMPMTTNQAVLALVADPSEIDEGLLYHLLASESARLAAKATGAAQANISKRVVLAHEIGVPPLPLQRKLGAMADAALDAADAARGESERLRDLRVNLLTALLSGEHEIPASYDRFIEEAA